MGCYAEYVADVSGRLIGLIFKSQQSVQMGPTGCAETSVKNSQHTLRYEQEE